MVPRHRSQPKRKKQRSAGAGPAARPVPALPPRTPPVVYGKAFVVLEDEGKNTFVYRAGAWVPYPHSITECRKDCLVSELPQKVNRCTRYEVRCPLPADGSPGLES